MLPSLLALLAQSQDGESGETVVRTTRTQALATDTPADHVVVTREELAATGERSLPRQISKATGVWLQETNLGGGSPLIQGLSGNQVLLVIDGVRMNDSTTRNGVNQMLNGIEPAAVERVEVLRGPRSVLYGSDALGGVVLIWTKRRAPAAEAAGRGFRGAVEGQADTALEGWSGAAELSHASAGSAWLGVLGAHDWDTLHAADGEVDNTGYEGDSLFGTFESALGAARSLRVSGMVTRDYDVPRTDRLNTGFGQTQPANEEFDFALQDRRRVVLAYTDGSDAFVDALEARLSFRSYDEERHIRATGSSTRRVEEDETDTVGIGLDLRQALGEGHLLTFGFDADYDDVDSSRVDVDLGTGTTTPQNGAFAPGSRFFSSGVFVQDEITSLRPYDVTLGARWGYFDFGFDDLTTGMEEEGSFDALSGSLAIGRQLSGGARVVGTLARGFRAPNLAELARDATFFGGDELHNPDLEPESSLFAELALEYLKPAWSGALAVYRNEISDVVGSRLIDPGGPQQGDETYLRENIGSLEVYGAFARGTARIGGPSSPWSASAAAEYVHGQQYSDFVDPLTGEKTFDDVPGQRIPPLHGWLGLRYDVGPGWLGWTELTTAWAFEQDRLSPQDLADPRIDPDGTDGWVTLDLDLGGPLRRARPGSHWFLGVHNLLDEEYRVHGSGIDGPGLGLVVGARWGF